MEHVWHLTWATLATLGKYLRPVLGTTCAIGAGQKDLAKIIQNPTRKMLPKLTGDIFSNTKDKYILMTSTCFETHIEIEFFTTSDFERIGQATSSPRGCSAPSCRDCGPRTSFWRDPGRPVAPADSRRGLRHLMHEVKNQSF